MSVGVSEKIALGGYPMQTTVRCLLLREFWLTAQFARMHLKRRVMRMAENIEREALLHDIEQSVVYTVREKITSAEMRGARKVIECIKCAPAVEPIYIHEPTKSEFKRMAAQLGYEQVVRCKDCEYSYDDISSLCCSHGVCADCEVPPNFYCAEGKRKEPDE